MFYLMVLLKIALGFLVVMGYMNLTGKTQLAQLTPVDFIGNFIIGGIIGGVIYSDAIAFHRYVLILIIGISLISLLNSVAKNFSKVRSVTIGDPIPIIKNGRFMMKNILSKSNKIDILNVASQLHTQGVHAFDAVKYAQIEPNGSLTVVANDGKIPSLILMKDGEIRDNALEEIDRDAEWLRAIIRKHQLQEEFIYLAEYYDDTLNFICKDGRMIQ